MLTIRYSNMQTVTYPDANYVSRSANGYSDIYTVKDGKWIAQVPNGCIIETSYARPVLNDPPPPTLAVAVALVMKSLRTLPHYDLIRMKKALVPFNARRRIWKF